MSRHFSPVASQAAWTAILAAAVSSLLAGFSVLATRSLVAHADPLVIAFLRFFPAGLCFVPALASSWRRFDRGDWLPLIGLGCVFYGLYPILFSLALAWTTALHAALVLPLMPLATLVFATLAAHETMTWQKLAGLGLGAAGVALAFVTSIAAGHAAGDAWIGDLLMVLAVMPSAIFAVFSRPFVRRLGAVAVTGLTMPAGVMALALVLVASGKPLDLARLDAGDWANVAFISIGGAAIANFLWIYALGRTTASRVAIFAMTPPVVAAIFGPFLLGEIPHIASIGGLALIAAGIAVAYRGRG